MCIRDRFYTEAEQDRFDNIDAIAIREALAERGIVNGQVVDPEKLDSDPFIRQVMRDVEAVATEEQMGIRDRASQWGAAVWPAAPSTMTATPA